MAGFPLISKAHHVISVNTQAASLTHYDWYLIGAAVQGVLDNKDNHPTNV
jgi:hypothetical protein